MPIGSAAADAERSRPKQQWIVWSQNRRVAVIHAAKHIIEEPHSLDIRPIEEWTGSVALTGVDEAGSTGNRHVCF